MATLALAALLVLCVLQTFRLGLAVRFLKRRAPVEVEPDGRKLYLLVPVIEEQSVIADSFSRFDSLLDGRDWLRVVFVTTAKERRRGESATTNELLHELIEARASEVAVEHYPRTEGVMAHQLNYAVEQIRSREQGEFFVAIYNVDSRVDAPALDYSFALLVRRPEAVLQQHALYEFDCYPRSFSGAVLSHVSAWQTRWTLHFEIGRLVLDHAIFPSPGRKSRLLDFARPLHYTIGHGLMMSSSTWDLASGAPEDEMNEDAFFGLILHQLKIRIRPIPFLERADPPPSISVYVKQQSVWFNGPLYAFRYARKLIFGSPHPHEHRPTTGGLRDSMLIISYACKLFSHALYWALGPACITLGTFAVAMTGSVFYLVAWAVGVLYFTYALNLIAIRSVRRLGGPEGRLGGVFASLVAYALHCAGPGLCIARVLTGKNLKRNKYKTERAG